jgi:hypothetical protein
MPRRIGKDTPRGRHRRPARQVSTATAWPAAHGSRPASVRRSAACDSQHFRLSHRAQYRSDAFTRWSSARARFRRKQTFWNASDAASQSLATGGAREPPFCMAMRRPGDPSGEPHRSGSSGLREDDERHAGGQHRAERGGNGASDRCLLAHLVSASIPASRPGPVAWVRVPGVPLGVTAEVPGRCRRGGLCRVRRRRRRPVRGRAGRAWSGCGPCGS